MDVFIPKVRHKSSVKVKHKLAPNSKTIHCVATMKKSTFQNLTGSEKKLSGRQRKTSEQQANKKQKSTRKGPKCDCQSFGGPNSTTTFFRRPFSTSRQPPIRILTHVSCVTKVQVYFPTTLNYVIQPEVLLNSH